MSALIFIAVLFVLVLVHEFGHFIVAKKTGMRVDEFGIGFPPRLFGMKRGETVYTLNAVPLGGFVKIYGEDADAAAGDVDSVRAFGNRPFLAQIAVLIAGVSMNVLFAWFLFSIAFTVGTRTAVDESEASADATLTVLSVLPESPAAKAGLLLGDSIVSVKNIDGVDADRLKPSVVSTFIQDEETVAITYVRNQKEHVETISSAAGLVADDPNKKVLGITMGLLETTSMPIHTAMYEAAGYTLSSIKAVALGIASLAYDAVRFKADFSGVAGPIGIAGLVGDAATFGLTSLIMFTAFISLNLAVINVLPFPALDGGRLLMVIVEMVKGSPIAPRIAYGLNAFGFILLMLLMVAVTYNDIVRLIG